jgi:alkylhydroperoxidase/carboxymuconolactone decarboxylase family protein YurZ
MAPNEQIVGYEEILRMLVLNDQSFVTPALGMARGTPELARLDARTDALVRVAASLATDWAPSYVLSSVEVAMAAGATNEEIVGTLIAVAPTVGLARVVRAAPELALALGYDVDDALERVDDTE